MKRLKKIPYINGDPKKGVKIDWALVRREYKKLGVPPDFFDPCGMPFERCKYNVIFSMRSVGKTTELLLVGLILWRLYGIQTQYIRQFESMIMPKVTKDLMTVIGDDQTYGYITKITDGDYNGVVYKSRRWYLCNYDEDGKLTDMCNEHFMFMCSIDKADTLKSGYNAPLGDFIVFDEFISRVYPPDEFVVFCDLVKTIIRDRESPVITLLANTIDRESPWYHELEIYEIVRDMQQGDHLEVTTDLGTKIYVEYVSPGIKKKGVLQKLNTLFYGFKNKRLGSITGEDWAIKPKPHIPKPVDGEVLHFVIQNLYVMSHNRYVKLDIVEHPVLGLCCYVHWATKTYEDSIILTTEHITDPRYRYGLGPRKLQVLLMKLITSNKFYYASDDVASFLSTYVTSIPDNLK